ncbi:MAG: MFS transporter [Caulobacteraceae bacterium]
MACPGLRRRPGHPGDRHHSLEPLAGRAGLAGDRRRLSAVRPDADRRAGAGLRPRGAVQDFDRVRAGQLVAEIVDDDYRATVAQAAANLAAAKAQAQALKAQQALQAANVEAARAVVASTAATLAQNGRDTARQRRLLASGSSSTEASEKLATGRDQLTAQLSQNRAQADAAALQIKVLVAQEAQAEAAVAAQAANLRTAQINLGYTRVVAPVDGVLGQRQIRPGQYVGVGGQFTTLTPLPRVWVIANYKETQLTHMAVGEKAEVRVDTFPGHVLKGHVQAFAPASGSQFALLPPDNCDGQLHQGGAAHRREDRHRRRRRPGRSPETRHVGGGADRCARRQAMSDAAAAALPPGAAAADSPPIPWLGLAAVLLGTFISTLNGRLSTFGLADIRGAMHAGFDEGAWITTAQTVAQMLIAPVAIWVGAAYGPRRSLLGAASAFAVISAVTPFASSLPVLLALQFAGGLASGFFVPLTLSFILRSLPPKYWAYGIAVYALNLELSLNISASLEGWYVDHLSWRWIFWQNVPLAIGMALCLHFGVARTPPDPNRPKPDVYGLVTSGVGLALIYAGLDQGNRLDWLNSGLVWGLLLAGAVLLVGFVAHERSIANPFLDLKVAFAPPLPRLLVLVGFLRLTILSTAYLIPQYLQTVRGFRSGAGGGADPDLDRRAAADLLSAGGADAAPHRSAAGVVDRFHLHQRRLPDGRSQSDPGLEQRRFPAVAAAAGHRPELRPVGHRLLRGAAPAAAGRPDLWRGGTDSASDGGRDRIGVRGHPDPRPQPGRLQPDRHACPVRRRRGDAAGCGLCGCRRSDRSRPDHRDRSRRQPAGRCGPQRRGDAGRDRQLRRGRRSHGAGADDRGGAPAGADRAGVLQAAVRRHGSAAVRMVAWPCLAFLFALGGCAVGPNYTPPPKPTGAEAPLVSVNPAAESVDERQTTGGGFTTIRSWSGWSNRRSRPTPIWRWPRPTSRSPAPRWRQPATGFIRRPGPNWAAFMAAIPPPTRSWNSPGVRRRPSGCSTTCSTSRTSSTCSVTSAARWRPRAPTPRRRSPRATASRSPWPRKRRGPTPRPARSASN